MTVTHDQAQMLATLAAACRPTGARRWDHAETMAALKKIHHIALDEVILATTRAASDRGCNSPFAITNTTSPHWRERDVVAQSARPIQVAIHESCSVCMKPRDEHDRLWSGDHNFLLFVRKPTDEEKRAAQLQYARQAVGDAKADHHAQGVPSSSSESSGAVDAQTTPGKPGTQPEAIRPDAPTINLEESA